MDLLWHTEQRVVLSPISIQLLDRKFKSLNYRYLTICILLLCRFILPQSEHAIPEQFRTKWDGKSLVTQCTDINA